MGTEAKQIEEPTTAQLLSTLMDAYCDVDSTMRPSEYHAIYACVNACSGIPTAALGAGVVGELVAHYEKLLRHFENTMAAVSEGHHCGPESCCDGNCVDASRDSKSLFAFRAALARAKGVANG